LLYCGAGGWPLVDDSPMLPQGQRHCGAPGHRRSVRAVCPEVGRIFIEMETLSRKRRAVIRSPPERGSSSCTTGDPWT
jgi:hypothetical protein